MVFFFFRMACVVEKNGDLCFFGDACFVVCKNEWVVYFVSVEREWRLCFFGDVCLLFARMNGLCTLFL